MNLNIDQLIPHREGMQLIEKVISVNSAYIVCESKITTNSLFYDSNIHGIYSWVGIEYIAQAISAYDSAQHLQEDSTGQPPIGFLLSVRKFIANQSIFPCDAILTITANEIFLDDGVGVFNGDIQINDQTIVQAKLSTYRPNKDKLEQILKGDITL